jgi:hypothetical protein
MFGTGHHKKKITITLTKVSNKTTGASCPLIIMYKYNIQKYLFNDTRYVVITDVGKEYAIFDETDGYDVSLYDDVFTGELVDEYEHESNLDFDDYTHFYAIKQSFLHYGK